MKHKAIIFDLSGTLTMDLRALEPGARELLDFCREKDFKMAIVTAGGYDTDLFKRLGLYEYMDEIKVLEMMEGKTPELFQGVLDRLGVAGQESICVGDLLHREIKAMNQLGAITIWIQNEWRKNVIPSKPDETPDFIAKDLSEVKNIIRDIIEN